MNANQRHHPATRCMNKWFSFVHQPNQPCPKNWQIGGSLPKMMHPTRKYPNWVAVTWQPPGQWHPLPPRKAEILQAQSRQTNCRNKNREKFEHTYSHGAFAGMICLQEERPLERCLLHWASCRILSTFCFYGKLKPHPGAQTCGGNAPSSTHWNAHTALSGFKLRSQRNHQQLALNVTITVSALGHRDIWKQKMRR